MTLLLAAGGPVARIESLWIYVDHLGERRAEDAERLLSLLGAPLDEAETHGSFKEDGDTIWLRPSNVTLTSVGEAIDFSDLLRTVVGFLEGSTVSEYFTLCIASHGKLLRHIEFFDEHVATSRGQRLACSSRGALHDFLRRSWASDSYDLLHSLLFESRSGAAKVWRSGEAGTSKEIPYRPQTVLL